MAEAYYVYAQYKHSHIIHCIHTEDVQYIPSHHMCVCSVCTVYDVYGLCMMCMYSILCVDTDVWIRCMMCVYSVWPGPMRCMYSRCVCTVHV